MSDDFHQRTWRDLIAYCMEVEGHGETIDDLVVVTGDLDVEFYCGFGLVKGKPFTAWTKKRVYFPVDYDGAESVRSASRRPNGLTTPHVGCGGMGEYESMVWKHDEKER